MNLGLHIIKNPNETYSFVGNVPTQLAYVSKTGNVVSSDEVTSQMYLPAKFRTIKSRSFSRLEDAIKEANQLGYKITKVL